MKFKNGNNQTSLRVSIIFYGNFLAFFEIVKRIALQIYLTGVNKMDIEELEFTDPVVDSEQLTITISIDNIDNGSKKNDG